MKHNAIAGPTLAAALLVPITQAHAIEPGVAIEAAIVSELIDAGESLSNRPTGILGIEVEAAGLFVGTQLRSLRVDDDRFEATLFGGFRHSFGIAEAEIGLERAWRDSAHWQDTDIFAGLTLQPLERLKLSAGARYAPSPADWTDLSAGAAIEVVDRWTVSGTLGRNPLDSINYGDIGVDYALTDALGLDLRWHRSAEISGRVVVSVVFALDLP